MDYIDKINNEENAENKVSEPCVSESLTYRERGHVHAISRRSYALSRYRHAKEFAIKHFDADFVRQLEAENFLIDAPFANDDTKEFEDIEKMYVDAESSGEYTQQEAEQIFAIWNHDNRSLFLPIGNKPPVYR